MYVYMERKERLINSGFYDLATVYQSVHVNDGKRRIPNGMYGAVGAVDKIIISLLLAYDFYWIRYSTEIFTSISISPGITGAAVSLINSSVAAERILEANALSV